MVFGAIFIMKARPLFHAKWFMFGVDEQVFNDLLHTSNRQVSVEKIRVVVNVRNSITFRPLGARL